MCLLHSSLAITYLTWDKEEEKELRQQGLGMLWQGRGTSAGSRRLEPEEPSSLGRLSWVQ